MTVAIAGLVVLPPATARAKPLLPTLPIGGHGLVPGAGGAHPAGRSRPGAADRHVTLIVDAELLAPDGIGYLLALDHLLFVDADLLVHDGALLDFDLLFAHRHFDGLLGPGFDRSVRRPVHRTSLDVDLLACDRYLDALLFFDHVLTERDLARLHRRLARLELFLAQLQPSLVSGSSLACRGHARPLAANNTADGRCRRRVTRLDVVGTVLAQDALGFVVATVGPHGHQRSAALDFALVVLRLFFGHPHADQRAGNGSHARADRRTAQGGGEGARGNEGPNAWNGQCA